MFTLCASTLCSNPLEVITVSAAEAAQLEEPLKDATSDITPTEVSFGLQT
jgi:hypothetical protein